MHRPTSSIIIGLAEAGCCWQQEAAGRGLTDVVGSQQHATQKDDGQRMLRQVLLCATCPLSYTLAIKLRMVVGNQRVYLPDCLLSAVPVDVRALPPYGVQAFATVDSCTCRAMANYWPSVSAI